MKLYNAEALSPAEVVTALAGRNFDLGKPIGVLAKGPDRSYTQPPETGSELFSAAIGPPVRVAVVLEGGCFSDALADGEIELFIADWDNDHEDSEDAVAWRQPVEPWDEMDPALLEEIVLAVEPGQEEVSGQEEAAG